MKLVRIGFAIAALGFAASAGAHAMAFALVPQQRGALVITVLFAAAAAINAFAAFAGLKDEA